MRRTVLPLGVALTFLLAAAIAAALALPEGPTRWLVVLGAVASGYMALNIGANDVANNMGPAVGARALTMLAALLIAAVFDAAGAILAGGEVVDTVANDLLAPGGFEPQMLVLVMITALLAAAAWINLSTFFGAPVSTTHAIIGSVVGAAMAASGLDAVNWATIGVVAVSWTLSPLLGAACAATLQAFIRRAITRRTNKVAAALLWVPILVAAMSGIFAMYLSTKVSAAWWPHAPWQTLTIGFVASVAGWLMSRIRVKKRARGMANRKKAVARLFRQPLVISAALLSFAHGANDVANALGPLAAILQAVQTVPPAVMVIPAWSLLIGALGIALGIALFGPRVIHTVGEQITKLNEIRAFCVALSAAITVLAASAFGLPVSSTHVAVGAVFGVGFFREFLAIRNMNSAAVPIETSLVDARMLNDTPEQAIARERRSERRYLVRRLKVVQIGAAWLVTLPASALIAAFGYSLLAAIA